MKKPKKDTRGLKEIRDYIRGMEIACDNENANPEQYKRFARYGSILDDLIMEVERDMQSNSLEYNELDTLQGGIDPSDSKDTNNICLIKLKNEIYKIYSEKNIKFHRENIEKYWILKSYK